MLKHLFTYMMALCGAGVLVSVPCEAAAHWQTNMDRVMTTAQAKDRSILVEFTGSDWCPPCIHLRTQIFPTDEFTNYVRENKLLLVELDFPRDATKLTDAQKAHNSKWLEHYNVSSFPTLVVMDAKGAPFGVVNGADQVVADYLVRLDKELKRKAEVEAKLAQAKELEGQARAEALAEALSYMPVEWRMLHTEVVNDIIQNDPEDKLGYNRQRTETALTKDQMKELSAVFAKYSGRVDKESQDAALAEALALLEDEKWLPVPRLYINKYISDTYALQRVDIDNVHKYLKAAVESAPESAAAKKLRPWLENLEQHKEEIREQLLKRQEAGQEK